MKIIVAGCGKIGTTIIASLSKEGHDIVALDISAKALEEITNIYDVMCICGASTDCNILSEAGVEQAELFVSVTGSDEINMLSCFLAKKMGAQNTISRIRSPHYNENSLGFVKQQLDLNVSINPEQMVARALYDILRFPSAVNIETFSARQFEMIELRLKPDSLFDGLSLAEIRKKYPGNYLIGMVQREDEIFIPDGNFVIRGGDKIGLTASPAEIQKLLKRLGLFQKQAKSVMILGASTTAYYLAKSLLATGHTVKIIDKDRERCEEISSQLPEAIVIYGDGAQQELLLEEGIATTDAFVSLTGIDEENILISIFANSLNVSKVITKVNRGELSTMAEKLGLETIVSPKKVVSDILSRHARAIQNSLGSNVERLYKLVDGRAEALEFKVTPDFEYQEVLLRDMKLKPNTLIAGIIRNKKPFIPSGNDFIMAGDRVVVLTAGQQMNDLSDIIR
ncbi:MAG: Trk system potassium transporter TrkA [Oscillospiraceae bacterium]|nr:Trk system potassium transporter TrkA [Oscillospiraceae bacterium]